MDLVASNGHLEEDIQKVQSSQRDTEPTELLWNCGVDYDNEFMVAGIGIGTGRTKDWTFSGNANSYS